MAEITVSLPSTAASLEPKGRGDAASRDDLRGALNSFAAFPNGPSHFRCRSRHTFSGVIDMSMWSTPTASHTAFT